MSEPARGSPWGGILLATINAKWIHPSLALRLLKANLDLLEKDCAIIEFALRQPLREKLDPILKARPRILGFSVSIWNHSATLELLKELHLTWAGQSEYQRPIIILGGPEVSYLPPETEIFKYADYCIRGEGEIAFRELCEKIVNEKIVPATTESFLSAIFLNRECQQVDITAIKSAYHLYTDEDVQKKLIYVEASRGCPFGCEFCQSAHSTVREFPLEPFLAEMDGLIQRGVKTFKFLDRTFNLNIERAQRIMEFFWHKIAERTEPFVVHFEMVPSRLPPELIETLARFPPGTLRLEIGIQTLNPDVAARIGRPSKPEQELTVIHLLREKTSAIIHADLIAGLPGEDLASFGRGFDLLWAAISLPSSISLPPAVLPAANSAGAEHRPHVEIQLGILKLLPGAAIVRHTSDFGMRYNSAPPYEVMETTMSVYLRDKMM